MKEINISVKNKIAVQTNREIYVCGNSDFIVNFDFDADWDAYDIKTARFVYNNTFTDVVFSGNQCAMPVISGAYNIQCGVFAGDLCTTTSAWISAKRSILCANGSPTAPGEDVYAQIMELLNSMEKPTAADVSAVFSMGNEKAENVQRALDLLRIYRGNGIIFSPEASVPVKAGVIGYVDGVVAYPTCNAVAGDIVVGCNGYIGTVNTGGQSERIEYVSTGMRLFEPQEMPYTTLTRDGRSGILTVHSHNLVEGEHYALHLYTANRRNGRWRKAWRHTPNCDFDDRSSNISRKGYGRLATQSIGNNVENGVYPAVPEWMPNGGYLQTEWEFPIRTEKIKINMKEWLLPMLKPLVPNADDPWAECGMIGIGEGDVASLLMQFRLVRLDDGAVGECRDTLKVGAGKNSDGQTRINMSGTKPLNIYTAIV